MTRFTVKTAPIEWLDVEAWIACDYANWELPEQQRYLKLKHCMELYVRGQPVAAALKDCGLSHEQLLRAFDRCIQPHPDGSRFGWRGLAKHANVVGYERRWPVVAHDVLARGGYAGALDALFKAYPLIKDALIQYVLTRRLPGSIPSSTASLEAMHGYFIRLCKAQGLDYRVWPLCTTNLGRESIRRFMHRVIADNYDRVVLHQYGKVAAVRAKGGRGYLPHHALWLPYDVVELDEHSAHFFGAIGFPSPKGWRYLPLGRLSLIMAFDRYLEDIVGAAITLHRMPNGWDILAAVHSCITAPTPAPPDYDFLAASTSFTDLAPIDMFSEGLDGAEKEFSCGFNLLAIDNALAHLADGVRSRIFEVTGAAMCYGRMQSPTCRAVAELGYLRLCEAGFERLPSTTGSHPRDPLRNDPEANASHFRMNVKDLVAIVSGCIKDIRHQKGKANHGITAASQLQQMLEDVDDPLILPYLIDSEAADSLLAERVNKRIAGSEASGRQPYISYLGVDYMAPWLANRWALVGTMVNVRIDWRNIQNLHVFETGGAYLGQVHAPWRWAKPHSADVRRMVRKLISLGKLHCVGDETYIEAWMRQCQQQVLTEDAKRKPQASGGARALGQEVLLGNLNLSDLGVGGGGPWVAAPFVVPDDARASEVAGNLRAING